MIESVVRPRVRAARKAEGGATRCVHDDQIDQPAKVEAVHEEALAAIVEDFDEEHRGAV